MRSSKTFLLPYIYLRLCATALAATLPTIGSAQLPKLSVTPNFTSLYDNETFLTLPFSNLSSLYDNLTSLALPLSNITLLPNQTHHAASLKDSPFPPDPTSINYGIATIWYFHYGPSVDIAEAQAIFRTILFDCQHHSPQARMGTNTRTYTSGNLSLVFIPEAAVYWLTWALVREELLAFATEYGYPEFDFAVTSAESGHLLGAGELRTSASNRLPPSPYYMEFGQGVVKFSDYGPAIDMISTLRVITEAKIDCLRHPDPSEYIDAGALIYAEGSVKLTLGPGPLMTWGEWMAVISVLREFLDAYEYVNFEFNILNEQGNIGGGDFKN